MEKKDVLDVSTYEKNKSGEIKLIKDLFKVVKEHLGKKHKNDTLELILHSYSSMYPYLEKYKELKKNGVIKIDGKNTPCGEDDEIAIVNLSNHVNKQVDIASLTIDQRNFLSKKTLFALGKSRVELLSKNFKKEEIREITEAVVLKVNKIYPRFTNDNLFVNTLKGISQYNFEDDFEF